MPHFMKEYSRLHRPEKLVDQISSQNMFIDNIEQHEKNYIDLASRVGKHVDNITALRALNTYDSNIYVDGHIIFCLSNRYLYQFNHLSMEIDNGISIITPNTGVGRWICISSYTADNAISKSEKSAANGVATLNHDRVVPDEQIDIMIPRRNGILQTNLNVEMVDGRTWPDIVREIELHSGEGIYNDLNMVFTHNLGKYPNVFVVHIPGDMAPIIDPNNDGYGEMPYYDAIIDANNSGYGEMPYGDLNDGYGGYKIEANDGYGGYKLVEATSVPCKGFYISENAMSVLVRTTIVGTPIIESIENDEYVLAYPNGDHYYIRLSR